jgi:hypothetical protein
MICLSALAVRDEVCMVPPLWVTAVLCAAVYSFTSVVAPSCCQLDVSFICYMCMYMYKAAAGLAGWCQLSC